MAFHKKAGLRIEDMVRSKWVYRKLRNFRADIEAGISCLKRAYGLARCTWRGLDHFKGTSGPRSWPTTLSSSPASNQADAGPPFRMHRPGQHRSRSMRDTAPVTPFFAKNWLALHHPPLRSLLDKRKRL
jgi:IS5 family transposase